MFIAVAALLAQQIDPYEWYVAPRTKQGISVEANGPTKSIPGK